LKSFSFCPGVKAYNIRGNSFTPIGKESLQFGCVNFSTKSGYDFKPKGIKLTLAWL
jgi:hypothetical protein